MKIVVTLDLPDSELKGNIKGFNDAADDLGIDKIEDVSELAEYLASQMEEGNIEISDLFDDYNVVAEYEARND